MADRDSLRRDAERKALERLRSRPRPDGDTPALTAWFDPAHETLALGVERFVELLRQLHNKNKYVQEWREVRTPEDHDAATGLDPTKFPDEFLEHLKTTHKNTDRGFSFSTLAFSRTVFPNDPRTYSAGIGYSGGLEGNFSNRLHFYCTASHKDHNLNLQEWIEMIRIIMEWRQPRLITVGSYPYGIYDRVFDHRAWQGWIGWFPQRVDPRILPEYALTFDIGTGTAVATQEHNVLSRYPDQKERANQVEMALVEAGILPTNVEVKGIR